jgi:hypothetical protein
MGCDRLHRLCMIFMYDRDHIFSSRGWMCNATNTALPSRREEGFLNFTPIFKLDLYKNLESDPFFSLPYAVIYGFGKV